MLISVLKEILSNTVSILVWSVSALLAFAIIRLCVKIACKIAGVDDASEKGDDGE